MAFFAHNPVNPAAPGLTKDSMNRRRLLLTSLALSAAALAACSDKAAEPAAAAPAAAPAAAKLAANEAYDLVAKQGHGFTTGAVMAANTVYVFFDPQCPHCAALWTSSKPLLNRLKVVWLPISLLGTRSAPQGATILTAPDPVATMNENEQSVLDKKGGIAARDGIAEADLAKIKTNTELFQKLGAESVPFIVYRNAANGSFGSHAGQLPTDQLAALVGL